MFKNLKTTFTKRVFIPSFLFMVVIALLGAFAPEQMKATLDVAKNFTFEYFSWFYVLAVSLFFIFLLVLLFTHLGDIRLGADDEEPEFGLFAWVSMLFAAGMGVGLMYYGVAEPMMHMASPITTDNIDKNAMLYTFYHWGVHPWAIYGVTALAMAFFGYRYSLPLSLRSTFYLLFKNRIYGPIGDCIDGFALLATIFGIVTTLGLSAMQLNAGLQNIGWLSEVGFLQQSLIIIVVTSVAILSAISGVGKGIKILSEINLVVALCLMLFVLFAGSTVKVLMDFSENVGYYLSNLIQISFKTFAYDDAHKGWFTGWTVLYWAWWASWAPFVGLFIARISRGRTVREFVLGVLIVPTLFTLLWFSVFGNTGLLVDAQNNGALSAVSGTPEVLLFKFLDYFPLSSLTSVVAMVVLALFFVTSADSGILVLNNIASSGSAKPTPAWQSVLWGGILIALAITLLKTGGIGAVQTMTLVVALPFMFILVAMCVSLFEGLRLDSLYFSKKLNAGTVFWSGERWKEQLNKIMHQNQEEDMVDFLDDVVMPAFKELQQELTNKYHLDVNIREVREPSMAVELIIEQGLWRNFLYGVSVQTVKTPQTLFEDDKLPHLTHKEVHEPITYFHDGRIGYDVQYMTDKELIADILKQYQRYLHLMHEENSNVLMQVPSDK